MVRRKVHRPEMHTTYLLKPGQTLENTKVSERTRTLILPKNTFQRFVDYATEKDRIAAEQEQKAAKIAALKKATYEKSKAWESTIENIKAKQKKELLSKKQKADEERKMFVKETAEKKTTERAEVVQQARKLLLQKKPMCRQINRSLFVSECLRELDAQVAFQKTIREMDKEQDAEYANTIKTNVAKYEEEKKKKAEEQAKKMRDYKTELTKQIEENERNNKLKVEEELEIEKEEQRNMTRNMQLMKEKEMQDILNKKKKLQQFFREAIEEKKRFELELKNDEEFEDRALEIYRKAKDRIQEIHKSTALREKEEKIRQMQIIAEQCGVIEHSHEIKDREILEKAEKEKEAIETEKQKAQKEREKTMRALMTEYKLQDAAVRAKQKQEEKDLKAWELMQRFKKDEYDKHTNLEERKRQWQQKLEYGSELRKDAEEKQIEKQREKDLEIEAIKSTSGKTNQRILLYANKVLEESKGVRPLYPIIKAIKECKKEMGLTPLKKVEETISVERPKRKHGVRRVCTKPISTDQICYL